jgi:hypothetical protein
MDEDHKFQLVLQLLGTTEQDFDFLVALEESIVDGLYGTSHDVDGHDFGSGTGNIFIHTNDPLGAFELTKKFLNAATYSKLKAAYRSFEEDDYTLIWPENSSEDFNII